MISRVIRNKHLLYTSLFTFFVTAYCLIIKDVIFYDYTNANFYTSYISIIILVYGIISWRLYTGTYFSLFTIYFVVFYLFTLGQSLLLALNIKFNIVNMLELEGEDSFFYAQLFTILCLCLFNFGGEIAFVGRTTGKRNNKLNKYSYYLGFVGKGLLYISIIPTILKLITLLRSFLSQSGGYTIAFGTLSGKTSFDKFFYFPEQFFIPALIMLIVCYRSEPLKRNMYSAVYVAYGLIYFFLGDRTGATSILLSYFWMDSFIFKKLKKQKKKPILFIFISIGLILSFPILGAIRNSADRSFVSLVSALFDNQYSIIYLLTRSIELIGFSIFPLIKVMDLIPAFFPYRIGQSYFFASLAIFPNLFGGTHIAVQFAGLPAWLQSTLSLKYGPGFSIPAEAWYNFGWYGAVAMIIFGYFFSKILAININKADERSSLSLFVMVCFFVSTITTPRREMLTIVRITEMSILIPLLLVWLMYNVATSRKSIK